MLILLEIRIPLATEDKDSRYIPSNTPLIGSYHQSEKSLVRIDRVIP